MAQLIFVYVPSSNWSLEHRRVKKLSKLTDACAQARASRVEPGRLRPNQSIEFSTTQDVLLWNHKLVLRVLPNAAASFT